MYLPAGNTEAGWTADGSCESSRTRVIAGRRRRERARALPLVAPPLSSKDRAGNGVWRSNHPSSIRLDRVMTVRPQEMPAAGRFGRDGEFGR